MLEARGLTKRYGGFLALDRVHFHVQRGEILSKGRAAERDMASFRDTRSESLEEVFVRTTGQEDFTPVARQILDLMQP